LRSRRYVQKIINLHTVHIYSLTSYLEIHKLFSLIQNIEFLGYISSYLWDKFELFYHLWLWFITGKNCCILGGYALMRRIKSSKTVTMSRLRLDIGLLFCRLPELLIEDVDRVVSVSSYTKFQWQLSLFISFFFIFDLCVYIYFDYYLEIIIMTKFYNKL